MLKNPPDPQLESIDGDTYQLSAPFAVKYNYWFRELQFEIPAGTVTDLASIPWFLRWIHDRASLGVLAPVIHDYLCDRRGKVTNIQGEPIQLTWFEVQLYFLLAMHFDGIVWHRALIAFLGVLIGSPRF
jgi:Protein of unknown function (DUF1353)